MLNLLKSAVNRAPATQVQWGRGSPIGFSMVAKGTLAGGFTANMFSSEENRGTGTFLTGALVGGLAGGGMHKAFRATSVGLRRAGASILGNPTNPANMRHVPAFHTPRARSFAAGMTNMGQFMHNKNARAATFASGALLAGGYFGSDRSRSRGFNSQRGNRFGG